MADFGDIWLIANSASGGTDGKAIDALREQIAAIGCAVAGTTDLAEDDLPALDENRPLTILSYGGDGTATAVVDRFGERADTRLLILPGGTMNLLARKLHGEAPLSDILLAALGLGASPQTICLPQVIGPDWIALVSLIAGPATAWGEVRENLRQGNVAALLETVPSALDASRKGPPLRIEGHETAHPAIFIEARQDELVAHGVDTHSLSDLALHGIAWLMRDFLGGPREKIGAGETMTLVSQNTEIALLVDGEAMSASAPLVVRHGLCPARFIATRQDR